MVTPLRMVSMIAWGACQRLPYVDSACRGTAAESRKYGIYWFSKHYRGTGLERGSAFRICPTIGSHEPVVAPLLRHKRGKHVLSSIRLVHPLLCFDKAHFWQYNAFRWVIQVSRPMQLPILCLRRPGKTGGQFLTLALLTMIFLLLGYHTTSLVRKYAQYTLKKTRDDKRLHSRRMHTFEPNCSFPVQDPTFVVDPQVRSTMDIAWSCFTVIVLCTWNILHLTVPPQITDQGKWSSLGKWLWISGRKLKWMALALLAPELLSGKAFDDLISARSMREKLVSLAEQDGLKWRLNHAFYANMGGFVLRFPTQAAPTSVGHEESRVCSPGDDPAAHHQLCNERPEINEVVETASERPDAVLVEPAAGEIVPERTADQTLADTQPSPTNASSSAQLGLSKRLEIQKEIDEFCRDQTGLDWRCDDTHRSLALELLSLAPSTAKDGYVRPDIGVGSAAPMEWYRFRPGVRIGTFQRNVISLVGDAWCLNAAQMAESRELGIINSLPSITSEEIDDKSKSDFVVKSLAVGQISWLVIEVITRTVLHKPSSQLEIMTIAIAACSIITYLMQLFRPRDVSTPTTIHAQRGPTLAELKKIALVGPAYAWRGRPYYAMPNNAANKNLAAPGTIIGGVVVGAIHVAAWNFEFPTEIERDLWRAASLVTAVFPIAVPLLGALVDFFLFPSPSAKPYEPLDSVWSRTGLAVSVIVYVVSRLFLIVESLRCLYFLSPAVYTSTLASEVPHVS